MFRMPNADLSTYLHNSPTTGIVWGLGVIDPHCHPSQETLAMFSHSDYHSKKGIRLATLAAKIPPEIFSIFRIGKRCRFDMRYRKQVHPLLLRFFWSISVDKVFFDAEEKRGCRKWKELDLSLS